MSLRIKEDDLELVGFDGGGVGIFHYQGKPFTGIMFENEKDNTLAWEQEYQNGYEEGWSRYYENGKLIKEYKTHNNIVFNDTYKEWDENGNLINSF